VRARPRRYPTHTHVSIYLSIYRVNPLTLALRIERLPYILQPRRLSLRLLILEERQTYPYGIRNNLYAPSTVRSSSSRHVATAPQRATGTETPVLAANKPQPTRAESRVGWV